MKHLLTILCVLASALAWAQHTCPSPTAGPGPNSTVVTIATSKGNVNMVVNMPDDYTISNKLYPFIIFLHGSGEGGTQACSLYENQNGGIPYQVYIGNWPSSFTNPADGAQYKFLVFSPQYPDACSSGCSFGPSDVENYILPNILAHWRVDRSRFYMTGISTGGQTICNLGGQIGGITQTLLPAAVVPMSEANGPTTEEASGQTAGRSGYHAWGFGNVNCDLYGSATQNWIQGINDVTSPHQGRFTNYIYTNCANNTCTTSGCTGHYGWFHFYPPSYRETIQNVNGQTQAMNIYEWMLQFKTGATNGGGGATCTGQRVTPYVTTTTTGGWYVQVDSTQLVAHPGDTIVIPHNAGHFYDYIYLHGFHGTPTCPITIVPESGGVFSKGNLTISNCSYVHVTGQVGTQTYGFYFSDSTEFPASISCGQQTPAGFKEAVDVQDKSKNVEIDHLNIHEMKYGFIIKNDGNCDTTINNWVLDSIKVHDTKIRNTESQGFYMGNTDPEGLIRHTTCNGTDNIFWPSRLGHIEVYNMDIDSTGRAAIQLSGAFYGVSKIHDNVCKHSGRQHDDQQGAAIALGSLTYAEVYNNTIQSTYTWNISSLGAYGANIHDNTMDSSGWADGNRPTEPNTTCGGGSAWSNLPVAIQLDTRPQDSLRHPIDSTYFQIQKNKITHCDADHQIDVEYTCDTARCYNYWKYAGNLICSNTFGSQQAVDWVHTGIHYDSCNTVITVPPPTANAGGSKQVQLPTSSVTLVGSSTAASGHSISAYKWTAVSGPLTPSFSAATSATTTVSGLTTAGSYTVKLTVTQDDGQTASDQAVITVKAANQPPKVTVSANQTITLPTSNVAVSGTASDVDGTVASTQWTRTAGPSTYTIVSPNSLSTSITGLVAGVYTFTLTATDNQGATASAALTITVNQPPVVSAAASPNVVTLPTNTTSLVATASDPDGQVKTYSWVQLAGPSTAALINATAATCTAAQLTQGSYSFKVTVTDNWGGQASAQTSLTVNPAPPVPPPTVTATVSPNSFHLPLDSTVLSASVTPAPGHTAGVHWTQTAGPVTSVLAAPNVAGTWAKQLTQAGTYSYQVTVTQDDGQTASTSVSVIVGAVLPPPPNTSNHFRLRRRH